MSRFTCRFRSSCRPHNLQPTADLDHHDVCALVWRPTWLQTDKNSTTSAQRVGRTRSRPLHVGCQHRANALECQPFRAPALPCVVHGDALLRTVLTVEVNVVTVVSASGDFLWAHAYNCRRTERLQPPTRTRSRLSLRSRSSPLRTTGTAPETRRAEGMSAHSGLAHGRPGPRPSASARPACLIN